MARVHAIRIEPLTVEAFAPFGRIIDVGSRARLRRRERHRGWHVAFESGVRCVPATHAVSGLRFRPWRGISVSQAFIPLAANARVAVAPPSADPDGVPRLDAIRAFLLDGSKGYVLHQGTWHSLDRFPLHPPDARFVMLTDHETQADLTAAYGAGKPAALTQEVDLERVYGIAVEFVP
jgi:ureidoglycolate hydrolase